MSSQSIHIHKDLLSSVKKDYSLQIEALEEFYPIIKNAIKGGAKPRGIKFGGGTALAIYYFQHRLSFDIDLFVWDRQYLPFFSPKMWLDSYNSFNQSEYIDQYNHIGVISSNEIKIDILEDSSLSSDIVDDSKELFTFDIYIETIEEIISKKIVFRKKDNKTRDIFDIALCINKNKNILKELITSGKVDASDIIDLYDALKKLNRTKYDSQIKIVEPKEQYSELAKIAPEIIIENIKELKLI